VAGTPSKRIGVVLAAGFGTRLGRPKATLECNGATLSERAASILRRAGCDTVIIVVGPSHQYWRIEGFDHKILNPTPEKGQGLSVVLGTAASPDDALAVILPVDSALVSVTTVKTLLDQHDGTDDLVVKPVFDGHGGHPMVIPVTLLKHNKKMIENRGLRSVQSLDHVRVHRVPVPDPACVRDLDTLEDFLDLCFSDPGR